MKVKRVKIGIKSAKEVLEDFARTAEAIERGEKVKKRAGVYFTSLEAFRKAVTPKRLELLHTIKTKKPHSINHLARIAKRAVKNVADDIKYLAQIGLIEKQETTRETRPLVEYDEIELKIAV
ncbi:MAG: hypothetical protein A3K22_04470 [Deltaproteobacteria bacterium RBG_16_42_7]|nr:MAG: hypothetical protein A3K22_04470 [Deltaproteobacteria bacterium RBG_16_42_7]